MLRILLRCACTHCGHKIDFPADEVGKIVQCPKCQRETELVEPDAESMQAEPAQATRLVVVPRSIPETNWLRDVGLAIQQPRPSEREIPERSGVPPVLKLIGSLLGIALIAAAILFFDDLKAWLQYLRTLVRW